MNVNHVKCDRCGKISADQYAPGWIRFSANVSTVTMTRGHGRTKSGCGVSDCLLFTGERDYCNVKCLVADFDTKKKERIEQDKKATP